MNYITTWKATCEECGAITGMFMHSGSKAPTKRDAATFVDLLSKHKHKDCGGAITVTCEGDSEERDTVRELVIKQERAPGGGRKAKLLPCPNCGTELSSTERRVPCKQCGVRFDDAVAVKLAEVGSYVD